MVQIGLKTAALRGLEALTLALAAPAAAQSPGIVQPAAGHEHSCVLRRNGRVQCWG